MEVLLHLPAELPSRQGLAVSQDPPEMMEKGKLQHGRSAMQNPKGLFLAVTQVAHVITCGIYL